MTTVDHFPAGMASTSGSGSLRARPRSGGGVRIDAPGSRLVGLGFGVALGLVCLVMIYGAATPPWPSGVVGWLVTLFIIVVSGGFSALGFHLARLGGSRLDVDGQGRIVGCVGSRWRVPSDGSLFVEGVSIEKGPMVRHTESLERRTWVVRLECDDARVAVLQAWGITGVRRKALRLASALDVTLDDRTAGDAEAEALAARL